MSTEYKELVNYYLVLDLKRNAKQDDIEMAYAKAALKHHPDVAGDSPQVQERFALINEAYSVLSNPEKKTEYDEKLGAPDYSYQEEIITSDEGNAGPDEPQTAAASRVRRPVKPETDSGAVGRMSKKKLQVTLSNARKLISKGDFWRADSILKQALLSYPRDPDIRRLLARAAEGRGRFREAVEELRAAVDIEYFNPENHYLMGRMFLKGGQMERAEKAFNDALSWQEDYEPAIRGIAEIRKLRRSKLPWWKKVMGQKQ